MADTGNGATLTLGTTGAIGDIRTITSPELAVEDVETSHLGTTNYKTFKATDLTDAGEISAEILFDATSSPLPSRGVAEVITITWPVHTSGNTQAATFIADGYIRAYKLPDFANGELQAATITIKLNGEDTEPAFTAET